MLSVYNCTIILKDIKVIIIFNGKALYLCTAWVI